MSTIEASSALNSTWRARSRSISAIGLRLRRAPIARLAGERLDCFVPPVSPSAVSLRTFTPKPADIQRAWHVVDADGMVLGRVATQVATLLRGTPKPIWSPHVDCGDHVIVINAAKLDLSARKLADKRYHRHSGYPGGLTTESLEHLVARDPERVVRLAVRGMLPKNRLGRAMIRKLRVYAGPTHPHQAQQPQPRALASKRS